MRSLHCARSASVTANRCLYLAERLEARRLLATDLGELFGRVYRSDTVGDNSNHSYNFTLFAPARVQVQISRVRDNAAGFFSLVDLSHPDTEIFRALLNDNTSADLPAGSYQIKVADTGSGFSYVFAAAEDRAGISQTGSGAIRGTVGLDIGTLSETPNSRGAEEFIGFLDTSNNDARDLRDLHLFTVPVAGHVQIFVEDFENDPSGGDLN